MIRFALPKGRNLETALAAFRAAGIPLNGFETAGRSLLTRIPETGVEVLSLKDWDLPLYVSHGVADCGIVGTDVLEEVDGDLLVPVRFRAGRSRMSLIGRTAELPAPGTQVRLATKYPGTARRVVAGRPWGAEILKLSGSLELAPVLRLAELALDIVQTGRTLAENGLVEIETVAEVTPCLVVNRASYQRHRAFLNDWISRLEAAEVVFLSPLEIFKTDSRGGRRALDRLTRRGEAVLDAKTLRRAGKIVDDVRKRGDRALLDYARKLDGAAADVVADLALAPPQGDAGESLSAGFVEALERAIVAVERFHVPQVRTGYRLEEEGVELEERVTPLRRVGLYVPGGRASYPSTVVMTVVPARVAGVEEIVVATPPGSYRANAALRYALTRLGVTEVWGMGGAHAVAALAYGTETIRRVDMIAGPGNAWVTAAKKLVVGDVAIDGLAGPSEVVIVADASADPGDLAGDIAADLLAQAEHDPLAAAVLITLDARFAKRVSAEIDRQLEGLATADTARASLAAFGAALVVESLEEALELVERIAPEHLQLVGAEAETLAPRVRSAGAIFIGAATPEVFGDYVAGPSHVLPTCGSARFASSLGVEDFLRRSHTLRFTPGAASRRAAAAAALADAEGLPAHAAAARRRLG